MTATVPKQQDSTFDVEAIRADFPILHRKINGSPLTYLDSAATTQKPRAVINAMTHYFEHSNANIHRGVHTLSVEATDAFEHSRSTMKSFINAREVCEIIFTRGATEALNIVASCYGGTHLVDGSEVIVSNLEHHSNIVPWQMVCDDVGAKLRVIPVQDDGSLDLAAYGKLLSKKTKVVAVQHISNALGTVNNIEQITQQAHEVGAAVVIDGAQASPHVAIDVQQIDCDFYAISGHKMYGPPGIGVLYGKKKLLDAMPPWLGGGDMIKSVTFEKTIYNDLPNKFEAGTPNISGVIGLGAAAKYIQSVGIENIAAHEHQLLEYATEQMKKIQDVTIIGTSPGKAAVISFVMNNIHPHDIGTILDTRSVAIRTGHHCAQPLMERFGIAATARASFAMYNTRDEVDRLIDALAHVREVFA